MLKTAMERRMAKDEERKKRDASIFARYNELRNEYGKSDSIMIVASEYNLSAPSIYAAIKRIATKN